MKITDPNSPLCYQQPVRGFIGRDVTDTLETVDYVPQSHVRIWRNHQTEGYDLHFHSAMEIIIDVESTYLIISGNEEYLLNSGDILIIPPNVPHTITCPDRGTRFICLFDMDWIIGLYDYKLISPVFLTPYLCSAKENPEYHKSLHDSFMKIIEAYFSNKPMWELAIYSEMLQVLTKIGTHHYKLTLSENSSDSIYAKEGYAKLSVLMHYIDLNYGKDLSLEQAADMVGFSKFHFSRLFKAYTDTTFYDYLSRKRIQEAQKLLATDMSITDICFQTGFNSPTSFSRSFKKYTMFSPSEYRLNIQKDEHN